MGSGPSLPVGMDTQGQSGGLRPAPGEVGVESGCRVGAGSVKASTFWKFSEKLVSVYKQFTRQTDDDLQILQIIQIISILACRYHML